MRPRRSFRRLFRIRPETPRARQQDVDAEIAAHIRLATDALIATGMSPDDAASAARARFTNLDATMDTLYHSAARRDAERGTREWFGTVRRDVKFALRQLKHSPAFALGVFACLAFGIGSSTTVFSWIEGLILRPLPTVADADRLVTIRADERGLDKRIEAEGSRGEVISVPEFRDWSARARSVSGLAGASNLIFGVQTAPDSPGSRAEQVFGIFATANYFDVVGIRSVLGRTFVRDDDIVGVAPVVVISHRFWQRRFAEAQDVIGRTIVVDGYPARIVGVAPKGFGGTLAGVSFDLWLPATSRPLFLGSDEALESRSFRWLDVIGRLRPGTTRAQAAAEFRAIAQRLGREHPENKEYTITVDPLDTGLVGQLRPLFSILIALTLLVVAIVCSNVANLLLVRSASRRQEIAVRIALGASRSRVVAQLMIENLLLAIAGAAGGVALAYYGRGILQSVLPPTTVPVALDGAIDGRVLGYVGGLATTVLLLFGLTPALRASKLDLSETLKNGGRAGTRSSGRMRGALVVAQFALSLTALVCGTVFLRRGADVRSFDRGYRDPEHVLLVQTSMEFAGVHDVQAWERSIETIAERLRRLPGVRAASIATSVPLGFIGPERARVRVNGYAPKQGESMQVVVNGVAASYFESMGIDILSGRPIDDHDVAERDGVAVVNEAFVRQYLVGGSPLGRRLQLYGRPLTVVGVARDGKYEFWHFDDPSPPLVYFALRQQPRGWVTFHVRTQVEPPLVYGSVRDAIRSLEPRMALVAPTTLAEYAGVPMFPSKLGVAVLGILGSAALVLAAMGLYSVIAYTVTLRTREIGIRLALGATTRHVRMIFLRESLVLLGWGVVVGTVISLGVTAVLHAKVGFLRPPSISALAGPAAVLAGVAVLAAFFPTRASGRVDVTLTLRGDC